MNGKILWLLVTVPLALPCSCLLPQVTGSLSQPDPAQTQMSASEANAGGAKAVEINNGANDATSMSTAPPDPAPMDAGQMEAAAVGGQRANAGASDMAGSGAPLAQAPAAGGAGTVMNMTPAMGMTMQMCVCSAGQPCCDGCNFLPNGSNCPPTVECLDPGMCQAGVCKPIVKSGHCYVSNKCFRNGENAPGYDCLYCDSGRASDKFSTRPRGTRCDDHIRCNGSDTCDAYGQCSESTDSPCPCGCQPGWDNCMTCGSDST